MRPLPRLFIDTLELTIPVDDDQKEAVQDRLNDASEHWLDSSPMARSNSPTLGHPKFPQAGRPDYDDSGVMAMRAAASLRR